MYVYYPYFRAKTFEIKAVAKAAEKLAKNGKIIPIFECVKDTNIKSLIKSSKVLTHFKLPIAIVVNPKVGDLTKKQQDLIDLITTMRANNVDVWPVLITDHKTTTQDINSFAQYIQQNSGIFIHSSMASQQTLPALKSASGTHIFIDALTSSTYNQNISPKGVILKDGFKIQKPNANYGPQSFFDDLYRSHQRLGYSGFGDYNIVGQEYVTGGGGAKAVALHITEEGQYGIECNHFLSVSNQTTANPAGKFIEALDALIDYSKKNPGKIDFSDAYKEFEDLHARSHFPGLADAKRLGMQHHLELMAKVV